jgi:hypothetical protein
MPRHKRITTCRLSGGPISKTCTCEHCSLSVCAVCGAYEGALTTDCPGARVSFDRQQEVHETKLDYTDDRGWHQGEPTWRRSPRFEGERLPPEPPHSDPRTLVAPSVDWAAVDRNAALQHELALRAIAWVLADRTCEDRSAALTRIEDEIDAHMAGRDDLDDRGRDLHGQLEREKISFHLTDQNAQKCDDEFRQAARKLVAALEAGPLTAGATPGGLVGYDEMRARYMPKDLGPPEPSPTKSSSGEP